MNVMTLGFVKPTKLEPFESQLYFVRVARREEEIFGLITGVRVVAKKRFNVASQCGER